MGVPRCSVTLLHLRLAGPHAKAPTESRVRAAPTSTPCVASFSSRVCRNTTFCTMAPVTLRVHPSSLVKPSKRSSPLKRVATGASTTTTDSTLPPETSLEEKTMGVRLYGSTPEQRVMRNSTNETSKLGYPTCGVRVSTWHEWRPRGRKCLEDGAVLLRLRHKDGHAHGPGRVGKDVGLDDGAVPKGTLNRNLVLAHLQRRRHNLRKHFVLPHAASEVESAVEERRLLVPDGHNVIPVGGPHSVDRVQHHGKRGSKGGLVRPTHEVDVAHLRTRSTAARPRLTAGTPFPTDWRSGQTQASAPQKDRGWPRRPSQRACKPSPRHC